MSNAEREKEVFGMTVDTMREAVAESLSWQSPSVDSIVISMMSDVQEQIALGLKEQARQTLNRGKWLLMHRKEFQQ